MLAARYCCASPPPYSERAHFSQYKTGVPPPPFCPLLPLLLRPTSLVLSRSVRRLPLAGDALWQGPRGAGGTGGASGAVEVEVEAAGGVGVAVGVEVGVEVSVAAVEAEAAAAGWRWERRWREVGGGGGGGEAAVSSGGGGGGGRRRGWRWSWSRVYAEEWLGGGPRQPAAARS
ncbi:unnamed protein product [Closterium sp. NIES-65]|nr:unnamed protein product [Closterium sp. NIES-65]